ncbi:hypothetical protein AA106555_0515 [Neokomagataea thailandica NBRC 106555]|uniref:Pyridoxamine 5'-phosphate oxidase family protein n=2 Tax=Neokomagataea TaxID=1223423 RepID=A0A4Y6V9B0_9PROT|nr:MULTISPECIES: pyridoxamine 5'-phosphate oxidase family protein [Neokomagataea]QDH25057.1 pyridoxamine 5'-phosphate oxidase family protein [Neokomagataea tanensis]GBR51351.1 hypothetical protein AA106555_0515 [Neokomagataea thailandica NBRC 106555]
MTELTYPITERSRGRRSHNRVSHAHSAVHEVLDAAPICHVGYVIDGESYVTPTIHWRVGNRVYWHGSAASRFLRKAAGQRVCLTVSLFDGYVMARSAFNHSANYRSAMVFGRATVLENTNDIEAALKAMMDDLFPNRWDSLRPMTAQELKATAVLYLDIEEATAKVRSGPPADHNDASYPVWAGVLPVKTHLGAAETETEHLPLPEELLALQTSGQLR